MSRDQTLNPLQTLVSKVGDRHWYQFRMFIIFSLKWLICGYYLMSFNFLFLAKDFTCSDEETGHGKVSCYDFVCDSSDQQFWVDHSAQPLPPTLSYQMGVFLCSKEWIVSTVESLSYWGSLAGFLLMPFISDNLGRKKAEVFAWVLGTIGLIIVVAAVNIQMVGAGLFISGLGLNSAMTLHYSFVKAFVNGPWRQRMIVSFQIAFSIGVCGIAATALFIQSWRGLTAIMLAVCVALCLCSGLYEETPEILLDRDFKQRSGEYKHLLDSLNRIARSNKREPISRQQIRSIIQNGKLDVMPQKSLLKPLSVISLFQYPSIRLMSYCCGFINMTIEFVYDATLFSLDRIGLNLYTNQIVVGLAEICSAVYSAFIVTRFRRRPYMMICLLIVGACLTLFVVTGFDSQNSTFSGVVPYIQLGLLILMRFVLSSVWGFFFVYIGELYPTQVMSLAFGYASAVGTLSASASPYIKLLAKDKSLVVMAALCGIACLHVYPMRETKGALSVTIIPERQAQQLQQDKKKLLNTSIITTETN